MNGKDLQDRIDSNEPVWHALAVETRRGDRTVGAVRRIRPRQGKSVQFGVNLIRTFWADTTKSRIFPDDCHATEREAWQSLVEQAGEWEQVLSRKPKEPLLVAEMLAAQCGEAGETIMANFWRRNGPAIREREECALLGRTASANLARLERKDAKAKAKA